MAHRNCRKEGQKNGDSRDVETDSIKYKNKRPRVNRDCIYYSYRHSTTSITSNTLWGKYAITNGNGHNRN